MRSLRDMGNPCQPVPEVSIVRTLVRAGVVLVAEALPGATYALP